MKMRLILIIATFMMLGCSAVKTEESTEPSIGVATMNNDRSITVQLRATSDDIVGDSLFVYYITDPEYKNILKHIGGIKPGESKPVRPWPKKDNKN